MKTLLTFTLTLATALSAYAADTLPTFNATLTTGGESRFVLVGADSKPSTWLKVGDSFDGYTVKDYDAKASALDLERDGKVSRVTLASATVAPGAVAATPATLADAQAVLNSMHFDNMIARVIDQQKAMVNRMLGQMTSRMGIPPESRDDFLAFQKRLMDEVMSALNAEQLKNDAAQVYSQVFTKEQLNAMSTFYSTPTGEEISNKMPDVQQKMQELMMPRVMAMMPKIQQMSREFAMEQQQKAQAAKAAAASAATEAAAPSAPAAPAAAKPAAPAPAATPKG